MIRVKVLLAAAMLLASTMVLADEDTDKFEAAYASYNAALKKGNDKATLPYAKAAYETGIDAFAASSDNVMALADNYAALLVSTGNTKGAAAVYTGLLELNEKKYGPYAASLQPMLIQLYKLYAKSDEKKADKYRLRYYKLLHRHNPEKIAETHSEGVLPVPSRVQELVESAERVIETPFTVLDGEHWVVIHPKGYEEGAKVVSEQLELAYKSMRSFFIASNLAIKPLKEKLPMIMFADQGDYVIYAESQDVSTTRLRGSYFEDIELLMYYDVDGRRGPNTYFTRMNVLAQEGFQQLGVAAGIFPKDKRLFPRWFYDGLSYTFEFNKQDEPFGPHKNNLSARNWSLAQDLIDEGEWLSLKTLIRFEPQEEHLTENKTIIYIMGTYFIRFLYEQKTEAMIEYVKVLMKGTKDKQSGKIREKAFRKAFGDVETVDKEWRRYMQRKVGLTFP